MSLAKLGLALAVVISSWFLSSCSTTPKKKPPLPATQAAQKDFAQVQIDLAAGAEKKAMNRLKKIVAQHPKTDIADDAYMAMGKIYYKNKDFETAYQSFIAIVNSDVFSPSEGEALLWASRSLSKLGRLDEALSLSNRCAQIPGLTDELRLDVYKLRFSLLNDIGDRLDALKAIIFIAEKESDQNQRESAKIRAMDFVESRLNEEELETVVKGREYQFVHGNASYRYAMMLFDQRDFDRARDYFSRTIELLPGTEVAERSRGFIEQIDARRKVDPRTIGAVLPLTGKHAVLAQKTLRGLQLGLGIYGPDRSGIRLAVVDSEGNPDTARRAVERLVTEDNVIAIVGSLLSRTSTSVAAKADELGVPTIALSQKSGLTEIGPTVFRNAVTSQMQVRHLVKVAMEDLGLKKFAILYPNDNYGIEYANLFWDEVLARGGQIVGAQTYLPEETDFNGPVRRLVGTYYLEDRQAEYRHRLQDWFKKQKSSSARKQPPDDLLPPLISFDALFVPDSIKALGQIAPMLAYNEVSSVRLLGTNLWNSPETVRRGEKHVESAVFVDSMITSDPQFASSQFYRDFKRTFGEEPGLFEAQAYDAGLLLRQILASGERSRSGIVERLSRMREFKGATGRLLMSPQHELIRALSTLTVHDGQIVSLASVAPKAEEPPPKKPKKRN